jgi:hypothetical protein
MNSMNLVSIIQKKSTFNLFVVTQTTSNKWSLAQIQIQMFWSKLQLLEKVNTWLNAFLEYIFKIHRIGFLGFSPVFSFVCQFCTLNGTSIWNCQTGCLDLLSAATHLFWPWHLSWLIDSRQLLAFFAHFLLFSPFFISNSLTPLFLTAFRVSLQIPSFNLIIHSH